MLPDDYVKTNFLAEQMVQILSRRLRFVWISLKVSGICLWPMAFFLVMPLTDNMRSKPGFCVC